MGSFLVRMPLEPSGLMWGFLPSFPDLQICVTINSHKGIQKTSLMQLPFLVLKSAQRAHGKGGNAQITHSNQSQGRGEYRIHPCKQLGER